MGEHMGEKKEKQAKKVKSEAWVTLQVRESKEVSCQWKGVLEVGMKSWDEHGVE